MLPHALVHLTNDTLRSSTRSPVCPDADPASIVSSKIFLVISQL